MTLRERIKGLCKGNNISMNKLETECGFARGYLSKLDKSTPNSENIQKLANYFNVSVDYLMTGQTTINAQNAVFDAWLSEDKELQDAIKKYYKLNSKQKKHIIELINLLSGEV